MPTVSYSYQLKERTTNICLCVCVCVCFIQRIKRIVWSLVDTLHVLICNLALVACVCFLFYYFMDIWLLCGTIIDMQANAVEITVLFTRTTITNARAHIRCISTTGCCNGLIFMCVVCRTKTVHTLPYFHIRSYHILRHTPCHCHDNIRMFLINWLHPISLMSTNGKLQLIAGCCFLFCSSDHICIFDILIY